MNGWPRFVSRTRRRELFLAATTSGVLRIAACVNVNGMTRLINGPGTMRKKNHCIHHVIRRGNTNSGIRQMREMNDDKHTVPRRTEKVWATAARTIAFDGVLGGIECRWKYHCDTVAAVVVLLLENTFR